MSPDIFEKFRAATGLDVRGGYGQTETALLLANYIGVPSRDSSLGVPSAQYHIELRGEDGQPVADGEIGEIVIGSLDGVELAATQPITITYTKVDGTWEPGLKMSGMKEGAVDCDMEGSNVVLPDDIQKAVEDAREKIASGELVPCRSMDELDAWTAENQYTAE